MLNSHPMTRPLDHLRMCRQPVGWILLALILFNGLVCSIGHGLVAQAPERVQSVDAGSHHDMAGMDAHHGAAAMHQDMAEAMHAVHSDPSGSAPAPMSSECAFAATLTLALIFFVALSWLQRTRPARWALPGAWHITPLRHGCSGLHPRAP